MGLSRRQFTKEFKLAAVRRLEQGVSIAEAAGALEVSPNVLDRSAGVPAGAGQRLPRQRQTALERGPHRRTRAQDRPAGAGDRFFEGVLAAHRRAADAAGIEWKSAVHRKVEEEVKAGRGLTIQRMVKLGRVSRSGFYRSGAARAPGPDPDMDLRDAIQRIALEWPSYGRPRITHELRRRGWRVNPKRVYRLMREDNLLCVRKRKFVVTTDANHTRKVYPNLARQMVLTGVDQLWVADITYIRLEHEFGYLAVILDAYSRRVIGWALARRAVQPGLVHHSDRGSQYASNDYTGLLEAHGIAISMSRKANPWDNAACESFMKTLKYEEVLRNEYRDLDEALASIPDFLEKVYNERRLHSALGYVPPAEFEASLAARNNKDAAARRHSV
jgi:putative transposase